MSEALATAEGGSPSNRSTNNGGFISEWQPISTAPKGSGEDGPSNVTHPDYVPPPKILLWSSEGMAVGCYEWYYHEGYGRGYEPGVSAWRDNSGEPVYQPTHWMPLPPPPKEEA